MPTIIKAIQQRMVLCYYSAMNRKKLLLILALASPVLLVVIAALVIYLPNLLVKPKYDFIYATQNNYGTQSFSVVNGRVQQNSAPFQNNYPYPLSQPQLYYYNVAADKSTEISLADVQKFMLDPSSSSPDGFKIDYGSSYSGGFLLFGSYNDYNTRVLDGHGLHKKLNLGQLGYQVSILGWVIK